MQSVAEWQASQNGGSAPASSGVQSVAQWKASQPASPAPNSNNLGILKDTFGGLSDAATTVGKYLGNKIVDATGGLIGASPTEIRSPQVLANTALGLPSAVGTIAKQAVTHPINTIAGAVGGAARGISDTVTNAIINLTPTSITGSDRASLQSAVSDTLDKYLGATPQNPVTAGFKQAGQGAPAIAAGGVGGELAGGFGMTAGFLGSGQAQVPLNASVSQRADQAMSDLVGLGYCCR